MIVIHLELWPKLTRADSNGLNKLLPPAVCANHQGQVRLLNELVHCVLWMEMQSTELGAGDNGLKPTSASAYSHVFMEAAEQILSSSPSSKPKCKNLLFPSLLLKRPFETCSWMGV